MPGRDLCFLSLDGGGIRGLSSLQVLKQLMERIGAEAGLESPPKPCEIFDMIGGTSTGGLLAIMLGRLKMDVGPCITAYTQMSDKIFRKKHHWINAWNGQTQARFDTAELEQAIKLIIKSQGLDEGINTILPDSL
ncbi:MAG: hypothetical protein M1840_009088 [Geoglossum simile]|nr:MAG: hypothetical protein M1840_009088 [Geoglossum simile]